ncbi:putative cmgc cdk protein kinase protein [Botrytis fragariae]|uniref:cyclin-dependent kinase n=1 Tax=Botrytis fragariae TaxID=1964551 RepID=A0A8H6B615_9HELO|nr:putative cmgc cdk protein kinase protein [Botrytis fragariae]KAF5879622.1 putative cmgc cdk protein kinase protein [Botrytis fragariae]
MATPSRPAPQATNGIYTPEHARQHTRAQSSFRGCSRISDYEVMGKIGEGTFGEILMINEKDGFPITALREIKTLKLLSHENVLSLEEMAVEHPQKNTDKKKKAIMYMVTPYFDHDLSGLLKNPNIHFTEPQIKCYMLQLLKGMEFIHNNNILHRDIKAANILINNKGILQIADFGLARHYNEPVPVAGKGNGEAKAHYTVVVVTRWYRPPELFLELQNYTPAIDIWGVGCVFGEMFLGKPILQGESEEQQLKLIFDLCGTPNEENMPGWRLLPKAQGLNFSPPRPSTLAQKFREQGSGAISLLQELLKLDWKKRTNAIDALKHPYFKNSPFPLEPHDIPILESSHEFDSKQHRGQKQAPPPPKGGDSPKRSLPSPPPHGGYRNSGPPHQQYDDRKPGWRRDDRGLPPRPPPPTDFAFDGGRSDSHGHRSRSQDLDGRGHRDRDHASLPRSRAGGGGGNIDTYIPSYNTNRRPREDRPPRDDRPLPRDDRRDDRPRHSNGTRHDYDNRGSREPRDSRSRSPNHDRGRDRYRDREPIGDPYAHRR